MTFEWTVKFGDILTSVTILVSVSALVFSWSKDRLTRETEQADRVREAAATALTQLDRWQLLNESLYQDLQPTFVKTSEMLQEDFDLTKARDFLWKEINRNRTQIKEKTLNEKIFTSYVKLLPHFPETRGQYISTLDQLRALEEEISGQFLEATQLDVMSAQKKKMNYTTARLGNALRTTALKYKDKLLSQSEEIIRPVREFLFQVIATPDQKILQGGRVVPGT